MSDASKPRRRRSARSAEPNTTEGVDIALEAEASGVEPSARARLLLDEQTRLIRAQLAHTRLQTFSERLGAGLKLLVAIGALLVVAAFGAMAWNAAKDRSLVITALDVPPDLAARGLTGEVLASQLLDKLAAIDAQAQSFRAPETIRNDWGGDIQVEIPQTGVSIGEIDRYLRQWLGKRTMVGGEVVRTPAGLSLTIRAESGGARTVAGTEADIDAMLQKAAEGVFASTQAYRYSKYLENVGRKDEALAVAQAQTRDGPASERAWAWAQMSNLLVFSDVEAAVRAGKEAVRLDPNLALGWLNLSQAEFILGHDEASYMALKQSLGPLETGTGGLSEVALSYTRLNAAFTLSSTGDFRGGLDAARKIDPSGLTWLDGDVYAPPGAALNLLGNHDVAGARAVARVPADVDMIEALTLTSTYLAPQYAAEVELEDWATAERLTREAIARARPLPYPHPVAIQRHLAPRLALALTKQGRLDEARAIIEPTPLDCYACVLTRAQTTAAARDWKSAEHWFGEASRMGPSLPFAQTQLGRSRLDRGDAKGAEAAFRQALAIQPLYPDAIHGLGDALAAQGDWRGAEAQYRKAADRSPNWGRNQLRWGQALKRVGKDRDARARFQAAARLPMTARDRVLVRDELAGRTT